MYLGKIKILHTIVSHHAGGSPLSIKVYFLAIIVKLERRKFVGWHILVMDTDFS